MGTLAEFRSLLALCDSAGLAPPVHTALPLERAHEGFELMMSGGLRGKVVLVA